jgi:hypothetical protein
VPAPTQVDPATQVKTLRVTAALLAIAGLVVGIGVPSLCVKLGITLYRTPWGFDAIWLLGLAMMVSDFGLAWYFRRRANSLERTTLGLPLRT